ALPRDPDGQGGGAAPVQVDRPGTALGQKLVGQIQLGQAGGVVRLPPVHRVEDKGAVLPETQGGAGLAPVPAVGPGGAVGDGAVPDHDVAHPAGPLGPGQVLVLAGGGQGD